VASLGSPASPPERPKHTVAEALARPEAEGWELIEGVIERKAAPSWWHARSQTRVAQALGPFDRRGGGKRPGGWWILSEVDVEIESGQLVRPDIAGWRRERVENLPRERPLRIRPDWIAEVLSTDDVRRDTVRKMRLYQRVGVPHYWVLDPDQRVLQVYRWQPDSYALIVTAEAGETVRAEPFDAIEIPVGVLFGDDPPEEPPATAP
jgi:Uma2 family endonuclease